MKKIILCLTLLISGRTLLAQTAALQLDENNKYVYYEVVDKPGVSADTLFQRALAFAGKPGNGETLKSHTPDAIMITGKFAVHATSLISTKESGEVAYALRIDTKDDRYRYKYGSFVFKPYKIDRFGNMVAVPGIEIPLEKASEKLSQKDAEIYKAQIALWCQLQASRLKLQMNSPVAVKTIPQTQKISTEKW